MQSLTYDTTRPADTTKLLVDRADGRLDIRWPVESAGSRWLGVVFVLAMCVFYFDMLGLVPHWSHGGLHRPPFHWQPALLAALLFLEPARHLWMAVRHTAFAQRLTVADGRVRWERMGWWSPRRSDRPMSDVVGFAWEPYRLPFRSGSDGRRWTIRFATGRPWRWAMHARDDLVRADLGHAVRDAMAAAGPAHLPT